MLRLSSAGSLRSIELYVLIIFSYGRNLKIMKIIFVYLNLGNSANPQAENGDKLKYKTYRKKMRCWLEET